jgi:(E)-4-hydroxy-3-methylbut-2-enyl-diphosphate synthase
VSEEQIVETLIEEAMRIADERGIEVDLDNLDGDGAEVLVA